jgi:catalase-peroxidase
LLWPIKQKYGNKISWADLIILTGNVSLESMGFKTFGFAGGREDVWEPEDDVNWGQETTWLNDDKRYKGDRQLDNPLAAVQMGLIYVNPEGPNSSADPVASAKDIRETFGRMAMNDEETVALVAGGHTFGKCHGAGDTANVGPEPEGAPMEQQGFGWANKMGTGKGGDTITSGLEGAWTVAPTKWDNGYWEVLFGHEWELTVSPAGAKQWTPKNGSGDGKVPDAHDPEKSHPPMMLTSDLALIKDLEYKKISTRFYQNPDQFREAFAKAWYKLTHRDMGPIACCLGPEVPPVQLWQDPVPPLGCQPLTDFEAEDLKRKIKASGLKPARLVETAWSSCSTFRNSDKRGGGNGARIRLEPQRHWEVNEPDELSKVFKVLDELQSRFNASKFGIKKVSRADMIVLAGCAGIEVAAASAGHKIKVPFMGGRSDTTDALTDAESFAVLEPIADGFRNYMKPDLENVKAEELLLNKAHLLGLTAPEMTVLVGGFRVLGIGAKETSSFTDSVGKLTNDFFVNLLDMGTVWTPVEGELYEGRDRKTGALKWTATGVDLVFGSNSVLRAVAEVYACSDSENFFVDSFVKAFCKVINNDMFHL